jgi:hypothetical protein
MTFALNEQVRLYYDGKFILSATPTDRSLIGYIIANSNDLTTYVCGWKSGPQLGYNFNVVDFNNPIVIKKKENVSRYNDGRFKCAISMGVEYLHKLTNEVK